MGMLPLDCPLLFRAVFLETSRDSTSVGESANGGVGLFATVFGGSEGTSRCSRGSLGESKWDFVEDETDDFLLCLEDEALLLGLEVEAILKDYTLGLGFVTRSVREDGVD